MDDDEVGLLIAGFRSALNAGRAPRSKIDEGRRVVEALADTTERLARGSPSLGGEPLHLTFWSFVEAASAGTQAEARLRRVAADEAGWPALAEKAWERAIGEDDGSDEGFDWSSTQAPASRSRAWQRS